MKPILSTTKMRGVNDYIEKYPIIFPACYLGMVAVCMLLWLLHLLPSTWSVLSLRACSFIAPLFNLQHVLTDGIVVFLGRRCAFGTS